MTYSVPYQFTPETGQTISSGEVDANFSAVVTALNTIDTQIGGGGGTFTDARTVTYNVRPSYGGSGAPSNQQFIDYKFLAASRGCQIGDMILSINPTMPTDYGIVWAQMQGQLLSQTTYPDFYALCSAMGGTATGEYNPAVSPIDGTAATAGNFYAPYWNGATPIQKIGTSTRLPSNVPNVANADNIGSVIGEAAHKQVTNEVGSHTHQIEYSISHVVGGASGAYSLAVIDPPDGTDPTNLNQSAGSVVAANVTQLSFVSFFWVRIK